MKTQYANSITVNNNGHHNVRIIAFILAIISVVSLGFCTVSASSSKTADADLVQYFMCTWGAFKDEASGDEISPMKMIYNKATTEDLERFILYKSQVNANYESTSSSLANLISAKDFKSVQLDILNNGNETEKKYTPYDRFGFAGMNFTNYNGEWNWYKHYYCRENDKGYGETKKPEDGHLNDYYKDRDRPLDTFSARLSSKDPRVRQKANLATPANNWNISIANFFFSITKIIVALGNMLLEITMTDAATKFGITDIVAGSDGNQGLFKNLFDNIFMTLMSMMVTLTAIYMLFIGIVKGKIREAYGQLAWVLGVIFVGLFMMFNPTLVVTLPNAIGMFGQDMLIQGITAVEDNNENALCATEPGDKNIKAEWVQPSGDLSADKDNLSKALEKSSEALRRNVECEYWRVFTLVPYSLGQYETQWYNLYAKGKATGDNAQDITKGGPLNDSGWEWKADYAGDAAVPLGNNTFINNWLIYQISTQTDYHVSSTTLDKDDKMKKPEDDKKFTDPLQYNSQLVIVDGANTDWWRVVDALANYKSNIKSGSDTDDETKNSSDKTATSTVPTRYWNAWIGGANMYRILISLLSILFAVFGLAGPIVIGLACVGYAIGSVLLMAFAPIALTFGMWAGRGQQIVKGFFQLLGSVVLKRIVMGFIFMLMSVFMIKIASGMNDLAGYFKSMLLICVVSVVFAKNKNTFAQLMGSVNIAGAADLSGGANAAVNSVKSKAKFAGDMAAAGVIGGVAGVRYGVGTNGKMLKQAAYTDSKGKHHKAQYTRQSSFTRGAMKAMGNVIHGKMRSSAIGNDYLEAERKMRQSKGLPATRTIYCNKCGVIIQEAGKQIRQDYNQMPDGTYLCDDCYNDVALAGK